MSVLQPKSRPPLERMMRIHQEIASGSYPNATRRKRINYPAVMKAIVDTGFKGFVAQEFIPKREDKIASLKQGVKICDV